MVLTEIYDLLYRLGITANYTGFFHMGYAVKLCCERPERLLMVTKWVYPEVAKHYQTNGRAVERNIRTVGKVLWEQNRPALEQISKDCLLIDLASMPGGIDFDAANDLHLDVIHALSLPGKTAPKAAAAMIRNTVCNCLKEEHL